MLKADAIVKCIAKNEYETNGKGWKIGNLSPGEYALRLRATSLGSIGSWTKERKFTVPRRSESCFFHFLLNNIIVIIYLNLAFITCGSAWYIFKTKFASDRPRGMLYASVNPEYMSAGYGMFYLYSIIIKPPFLLMIHYDF